MKHVLGDPRRCRRDSPERHCVLGVSRRYGEAAGRRCPNCRSALLALVICPAVRSRGVRQPDAAPVGGAAVESERADHLANTHINLAVI